MKRYAIGLLLLVGSLALQGCASSAGANRLLPTITGDKLFVRIDVRGWGITAELAPEDAAEIRKLMLLRPTVPVLLMPVKIEEKAFQ